MNSRHLIALLIVLSLAGMCGYVTWSSSRAESMEIAPGPEALDDFDRVVQQRFHNVIGFGMARVASQRWFVPETKPEKDSVKALNTGGYEVCLYLVGRNILMDIPERRWRSDLYLSGSGEHLMSGPVFVGNKSSLKRTPDGRELWEPARAAMRRFDEGAARDGFQTAGWNVEARPVRASDDQCLSCHGYDTNLTFDKTGRGYLISRAKERNKLRVGDTLGALLYVYRKKD